MEILPSGKTGADKFDLRSTAPTKVWDRLSARLFAQSMRKFFEVVRGWSYSGNEGSSAAIDDDLSIITTININDYESSFTQGLNTLIAFNNTLIVDGSSTANDIVLVPQKISSDVSPNGTNYSTNCVLPLKYQDNLEFNFIATATNTRATTISIPSLSGLSGAVDLLDESGNSLVGGEIYVGKNVRIKFKTISTVKKAILINESVSKRYLYSPSFRNKIMNGSFNIWQRGTSFTSVVDQQYSADRWLYAKSGTMVHDISLSTDIPTVSEAGILFNYSLLADCQTADSSISATDFCVIEQRIEGYNFAPIAQKPTILSFWVKATKTGIYSVYLKNGGGDRGYVGEYTVNASNTWEFKTVKFSASPSSGTWNYTNGIGAILGFSLACGSNYQITAGSWQNGGYLGSSNQVNACDSTSNNFRICGVQLEEGLLNTPFESRSFEEELYSCQRYYEKSWDYSTALGTVEEVMCPWGLVSSTDTTLVPLSVNFKVSKRAAPTMVVYDPATGNTGKFKQGATQRTVSTITVGEKMISRLYATAAMTAGDYVRFHFTASAEL